MPTEGERVMATPMDGACECDLGALFVTGGTSHYHLGALVEDDEQ